MKKLVSAVAVLAVSMSGTAQAAGYVFDVLAGRGTGMGSAMVGHVDDASAVFYNAAGIAQGKGFDLQLGATFIAPDFDVIAAGGGGREESPSVSKLPPPHAYATWGITDDLSVGLGFFIPYGLAYEYPEDFSGRFVITEADLRVYVINPTVAYKWRQFRFGGGVQVVRGTVLLGKDILLPENQIGAVELGGAGWAVGGNLGVQWEPLPNKLKFGAFYRSTFSLDLKGNAHFSGVEDPSLRTTLRDQPITANFKLPDQIGAGVAFRPVDRLLLDFDAVYYGWQRFQDITVVK